MKKQFLTCSLIWTRTGPSFFLTRAQSFSVGPKNDKCRLGPAHRARSGRTQAATWAWAGKAPRPRAPAWAATLAPSISVVRADPTAERAFRSDKTRRRAPPRKNPRSFSLPLSLSSFSLCRRSLLSAAQPQPSDEPAK
jgi:hypothetical protein